MAALAVTMIVTVWARDVFYNDRPSWWAVGLAVLLGFVGFYLCDPPGAKDATRFIERTVERGMTVWRGGRRKTDPPVIVPAPPPPPPPKDAA